MNKLLLLFLLLSTFAYSDIRLKERLVKANAGDFIVTTQGSHYSLLLIRSLVDSNLILEEITTDQSKIDLKKIDWKKWVENKAPGVLSWTSFVIDLKKESLSQCYSYTERQWLFIEKSDYYFNKLLNLPFRPSRDNERKRIGPPPMQGEIDRRKLWKPQLIRNGKKIKKTEYEVLRMKWPADKTHLAGCIVELYLDAASPNFPFPYWMEVQHPHFTFKIRTIDSGFGIISPMPLLN